MKKTTTLLLVGFVLTLPIMAIAQPGPGHGRMMEQLDLTDEQQIQMQTLRLDHQKEMMTLRDERHSLRTEMNLLLTEDNPSSSKIRDLAGKTGDITKNIALAKADHKMKVRNILNDEQKVQFDLMTLRHSGPGHKRGHGRGFGPPSPPDAPAPHFRGFGRGPSASPK